MSLGNLEKADTRPEVSELFRNLKLAFGHLQDLLQRCHEERADGIYRFYHQSFKVYYLQQRTEEIVTALRSLAQRRDLNNWFVRIVTKGTGKSFSLEDNKRWLEVTRPIVEAFFHASHFLEMAVKSARELSEPPNLMPSEWAAVLYLYNLR